VITDVTLYNAYLDAGSGLDKYSRTQLKGVRLQHRTLTNVSSDGLVSADEFVLRVPAAAPVEKNYVSPKQFASTDKAECFTFAPGDVVAVGLLDVEIAKTSDLAAYETMTILGATDNRVGLTPHWKVTGK
jgi:hypothetical protein